MTDTSSAIPDSDAPAPAGGGGGAGDGDGGRSGSDVDGARPRRRRPRSRPVLITLGVVVLLLVAGIFVLRSSWFITGRVESTLSRMLGGPVEIERSTYLGRGRFRFTQVEIRAPGIAGEPGRIGLIDRVQVDVDPSALRRLQVVPLRVSLGRFRLRISENAEAPGQFTFAAMGPRWEKRDDALAAPEVSIDRLEIEVGEHRRTDFFPRVSRAFTASMRRATARDGEATLGPEWNDIELFELRGARRLSDPAIDADDGDADLPVDDGAFVKPPDAERIKVSGRWNAASHEHSFRVEDLFLSPEVLAMAPAIVREVMDEMELGGQARNLNVGWTPAGFRLAFEAADLVFRLPVDAGLEWARYRRGNVEPVEQRPRLRVDRGRFAFDGKSLRLEGLEGRIAPAASDGNDVVTLPYTIDLDVRDLEPLAWSARGDWARQALAAAGFTLEFSTTDLSVGEIRDPNGAVRAEAIEVPVPIAGVLEQFEFDRWDLQTRVEITRQAGTVGPDGQPEPGEIKTQGWASIRGASGRYAKFPYRLDDIEASVNFQGDAVTIDHVTGRGAGDSVVVIRGQIDSAGSDPEVHLTLTGTDIPVDTRLRDAFGPTLQGVLDRLRDPDAVASLVRHGLLDDDEAALGGRVNLRLSIDREAGPDVDTITTGEIDLRDVDVVLDRFPYPMTIESGRLDLAVDELRIIAPDEGMPVRTAGGGRGRLSGRVSWAEGTGVRPDLHVSIGGDAIGPILFAALPPSEAERSDGSDWSTWPGGRLARAGEWLDRLDLTGGLDFECDVTSTESGEIDYVARVELQRAAADAAAAIAVATGRAHDEPLTGDWSLDAVRGTAVITPMALRLEAIAGATTGGTLDVNGELSLDGPARRVTLDIAADGLRVDSHLRDAMPAASRDRIDPLIDRYRPRGSVDAALAIISDGMGDVDVRGRVTPSFLEFDLQSQPVQFVVDEGGVELAFGSRGAASVRTEGMQLSFREPDGHAAGLRLEGGATWADEPLAFNADADADARADADAGGSGGEAADVTASPSGVAVDLVASWSDARLRSPLLAELLLAVGAGDQLERIRDYRAAGRTDVDVVVHRGMDGRPRMVDPGTGGDETDLPAGGWRIVATPRDFSFRYQDRPFSLDLDPEAEVRFESGMIRLVNVAGRNSGSRFKIDADFQTDEPLTVDARFDVVGTLLGPQVAVFLPDGVRRALESLSLQERQASELRDVRLRARRVRASRDGAGDDMDESGGGDSAAPADAWSVDFDGRLVLNDASMEAGLLFGSINGPFDISLATGPDRPLDVLIEAHPSTLTLAGQTIRDLDARIRVDPDARRVTVDEVSGAIDTGRLVASAVLGLDPGSDYSINVDLAGAPLSDFVMRRPDGEATPDAADRLEAGSSADADPEVGRTRHKLAGDLYARFSMEGKRGDAASRIGRGHALVNDADLFAIPSVLQFVQAIQFSPPAGRYDYASTRFFLAGERLHFDELYLESQIGGTNTNTLTARGSVDLRTQEIEGRIRSRSGVLLPLRELVGGFGDALAAIELEGTLRDPGFRVELLRGNRREEEAVLARPRTTPSRVGAAAGPGDEAGG